MTVGVVVIGRNEGNRLRQCLESAIVDGIHLVYVDSGSIDNSLEVAQNLGVKVVKLDMSQPFTAARARNVGFQHLEKLTQNLEYVQFVDGDCELRKGWIENAYDFFRLRPQVAVACGCLRERFPKRSVYNQLCDMEWDSPMGEIDASGGIAMIRADAFRQVEGFNSSIVAGEEPELCFRLRQRGWKIWRIDVDMALHDANMTQFAQWWTRSVRAGYSFAEGRHLHGDSDERYYVRESNRAWIWGGCIPALIIVMTAFNSWFAFLVLVYPIQMIRVAMNRQGTFKENLIYGVFVTLAKFPETAGQLKYILNRFRGEKSRLIEYK